ncbi:MAG: hypothetical protein EBT97_09200 [Actinobacteria bacterium]|jgi:hypothetical protein|nr:hypothetical protein [Actinomycetota bacterium]
MSTSYTQLYDYIRSATENDDTEFAAAIPTFIDQTRMRLARDIDTYGFVVYTTAAVSTYLVSIPSDALVLKNVTYVSAGRYSQLIMRTDEFLREYWPQRTSVGEPKYYARWGYNQILVAPAPSTSASLEISYVQIPTSIGSVGTSTNWLTEYAPEALFYGCMQEACMFMKNYQAAALWEGKYQDAVGKLRNEARRTRQDDNLNNNSPAGGDNTLQGGV